MKILAIIRLATDAPLADVRARLEEELRGSWSLYTSGVLREAYATSSPTSVVFVLEAESEESARQSLASLPLVAAKAFSVETMELRPFSNWSMLFR